MRLARRLTHAEVARRMRRTEAWITGIEKGTQPLMIKEAIVLADILRVPLKDFFLRVLEFRNRKP